MNKSGDYQTQVAHERIERLRQLQKELPPVCSDFFRSISQTTSPLTRLVYAYDFRLFFQYLEKESPTFADIPPERITNEHLNAVTKRDIENFQDYLVLYLKQRSDDDDQPGESVYVENHELGIMRKLCSLRALFEYLFISEIVPGNVAALVPLPKIHDKPILRLEQDETEKLLSIAETGESLTKAQARYQRYTKKRDVAMLMLFLGTGIRVSECVGIDLDDLDFDLNAFLVTRKGGSQTVLYFPEQVADALREYIQERSAVTPLPGHENALFLSLQKRRITQRAVQNLVKKYALLAAPLKKRMSPHKLRSTFGTNLYNETGDIYLVADVLGHADVNTTRKHYAAMSDARKREAARRIALPKVDAGEPDDAAKPE